MSYLVSIVRTDHGHPRPIKRAEIETLVRDHSRFRISPGAIGELDLVEEVDGGGAFHYVLQDGELWTKNPGVGELRSMIAVANLLGGRVRGEEFETYRSPTETFRHPDDEREVEAANAVAVSRRRKVRNQQRVLNLVIMITFLLLGLLAIYFSN